MGTSMHPDTEELPDVPVDELGEPELDNNQPVENKPVSLENGELSEVTDISAAASINGEL